ncbi:MAG: hypothetical protein WAN11_06410 [Syntrophobacteraceae bacterium]
MGKSQSPKPKGRPDHILISGAPDSGPDIVLTNEVLDVWLEKIDPTIHARTSNGDIVVVEPVGLDVSTSLGVLGSIPQKKASAVMNSGFRGGFVLNMTNNPKGVQVRLS